MSEEFIDQFGETLKLGCIPKEPTYKVGSTFEENFEVWDDATILEVVKAKQSVHDFLKAKGFWDVFTKKANQNSTSACNGWLTANAFTLARYLGGITDGTVYSGAYNYSLMNGGSDNGSALVDGLNTASQNGFVPVELCPWNYIYRNQTKAFDGVASQNKAADPYPTKTLQGYKTALAKGFMCGCAIQFGRATEQLDANGVAPVVQGGGNHAVCSIDIKLLPNGKLVYPTYLDWGPQHGRDGLIGLTDAHYSQTIGRHLFWAMPLGQTGGM